MWVTHDNLWVWYAGSAAIILLLYAAKWAVLRYTQTTATATAAFAAAVAAVIPVTWGLSPDWDNPNVLPASNYVGTPVATLGVPIASFLVDLARRSAGGHSRWLWRVPLEVLIAVPLWFVVWMFVELLVLGWVWI